MKKLIILTLALLGISCSVASAATGDTAGHIYSTDIRAYINDVEVPSYNIGGKTAVILEDITDEYNYVDEQRSLLVGGFKGAFRPDRLIGGKSEQWDKTGDVLGEIYETDIKTFVYDKEIPAYNIGGKTAVAIEDLGNEKKFSEIGGKYVWDDNSRTIGLEFIYENVPNLSENQLDLEMTMDDNWTKMTAVLKRDEVAPGSVDFFYPEESAGENNPLLVPIVVELNGREEQVGYYFSFRYKQAVRTDEGREIHNEGGSVMYFDLGAFNKVVESAALQGMTREEVIQYYMDHSINKVNERFDTDDYTFLYAGFYGTPHGGAAIYLLRIDKDGRYHNYITDLNKRSYGKGAQLTDVTVDKEKEKVYIKYDKDYTIDLKTGEFSGDDDTEFVSAYPALPENGRNHYVIYNEGYRDNRVELSMYDGSYVLLWDKNNENGEKRLGATEGDTAYKNDIKYYLDGDKWIEFEQGYNCVSNNATAVLETDVKVVRGYQPQEEEYPQNIPVHPTANTGTVAGDMYYTDIKGYVFEAPITSYNIGGRTVIDTEALSGYYGFDVTWHENERWLEVTDAQTTASSEALQGAVIEGTDGITGEKAGVYYNTDIVATLNGKEIEAYNIGGRTFLVAENMRDFEYIVDWNEESRELRVSRYPSQTEEYTDEVVNNDTGVSIPVNHLKSGDNYYTRGKGSCMLFADKTYYLPLKYGFVYDSGGVIQYVRLSEIVKALNADYEITAEKTNDGYKYALIINYDKTDIPYLSDTDPNGENSFRKGDTIGKGFIKYLSEYKIPMTLIVNGETPNMHKVAGLKDLDFHILVLNGEVWIPENPLNAMFGFDAI